MCLVQRDILQLASFQCNPLVIHQCKITISICISLASLTWLCIHHISTITASLILNISTLAASSILYISTIIVFSILYISTLIASSILYIVTLMAFLILYISTLAASSILCISIYIYNLFYTILTLIIRFFLYNINNNFTHFQLDLYPSNYQYYLLY